MFYYAKLIKRKFEKMYSRFSNLGQKPTSFPEEWCRKLHYSRRCLHMHESAPFDLELRWNKTSYLSSEKFHIRREYTHFNRMFNQLMLFVFSWVEFYLFLYIDFLVFVFPVNFFCLFFLVILISLKRILSAGLWSFNKYSYFYKHWSQIFFLFECCPHN